MSRLTWALLAAGLVVLASGVVWLDRRQAGRGAPSLVGVPWPRAEQPRGGGTLRSEAGAPRGRLASPAAARVAVIVDELGGRADVVERVMTFGPPVTLAVLPDLPLSRRVIRDAVRAGREVLLQVPLEPYRFPAWDPGPGVLLLSMTPQEIRRRARLLLAAAPGVAGVATHMGSRFTEDPARMRALLEVVRTQGLFFVDSVTTSRSTGYDAARAMGLRAARRQVFLDPEEDEATGRAQLRAVEDWAARRGSVVAIGHGRLLTVQLLEGALKRWEAGGLRIVPVSELAN